MENEKFAELEKKVRVLIDEYQVLKRRNVDLEMVLKQKEGELAEANGRSRELMEEKDAVREKVDSLLHLLHEIPS
ncbi:MAG TPA: cell division protein ZapB [Syntrophales bacterium]|nr:cell division protein ZapB [Syntrophales bacterium]HQB31232.1 cell division protein ZapB [Syntrophales bacterium]HQN78662.1 cell division protein ZapB [Syntrophales bacterium]HQQ28352.1 cell division protein ZapB [Syntrophales bacterium]